MSNLIQFLGIFDNIKNLIIRFKFILFKLVAIFIYKYRVQRCLNLDHVLEFCGNKITILQQFVLHMKIIFLKQLRNAK